MAIATHASRVLQFVADEVEDPDFAENLRIYFNLPKMVPEIILPDCVSRHHFLQWDPRVFMPGSIWCTVSFLPDGEITDNEYYLFVAVVFSVDNRMREGEPRVWRELIAAWDATFGLAPGELRPNVAERRYGSLTVPALGCSGDSLDYALSGESCNLTREEHTWLKDCLYHYDGMIDSLEMLRNARERMVTEDPRWWRASGSVHGELHWMPQRFWGANDGRGPPSR